MTSPHISTACGVVLATIVLAAATPAMPEAAPEYVAYRARAQTPQPQGIYFAQPLKLSFRDLAMRAGSSKRYRVCVVDGKRVCYARIFYATANADWDSVIHRTRQATDPIMVFWYVGTKIVWAATVVALGD